MFKAMKSLYARLCSEALVDRLVDDTSSRYRVTSKDLHRFLYAPADVADKTQAMGEVFGLSAGVLRADKADWYEILETCAACKERATCDAFLRRGRLAMPRDAKFCPNQQKYRDFWAAV